jgi:hypothetical protein
MRLVFTLGITNAGQAVILKDHTAVLREHKSALNSGEYQGEYSQVFILETSRANKKKRFGAAGNGRVNFGTVLPVDRQTKKSMAATTSEMKGGDRGATEGRINFGAALPVHKQTKKSMESFAADQHGGTRGAPEGKVHFDTASLPVRDQKSGRRSAKKAAKKTAAKSGKARTRRGGKTSSKKSAKPAEKSPEPKSDQNPGSDAGPTL